MSREEIREKILREIRDEMFCDEPVIVFDGKKSTIAISYSDGEIGHRVVDFYATVKVCRDRQSRRYLYRYLEHGEGSYYPETMEFFEELDEVVDKVYQYVNR